MSQAGGRTGRTTTKKQKQNKTKKKQKKNKKYIYIYIQFDVHQRSQDSALLAVKERNRPVGELLKS